jgi:hypothetical protein
VALALILDWARKGLLAHTSELLDPDFHSVGVSTNATPKTIATSYRIIMSIEPGAEAHVPPPKLKIVPFNSKLKQLG